jgi:hypothetical protein
MDREKSGLSMNRPIPCEVLGLVCSGCSDKEIVKRLGLSRNTVRNHVAMIYSKIDVHRRGAAIVWARERGFTGPSAQERQALKTRDGRTGAFPG